MGLGHVQLAMVQAEAAKSGFGPFAINAQAPDEGNMHTLLHWGTDEQKQKYLKPLCEGTARSCFAMTEPEVAGSDPTLIQTTAVRDGDHWVINGHKWFISGAQGAHFAILIARTNPDGRVQAVGNGIAEIAVKNGTKEDSIRAVVEAEETNNQPPVAHAGSNITVRQGTRVRPLTKYMPKPMIPILGKPVLEYLIEHLARYGVKEIMINVAGEVPVDGSDEESRTRKLRAA